MCGSAWRSTLDGVGGWQLFVVRVDALPSIASQSIDHTPSYLVDLLAEWCSHPWSAVFRLVTSYLLLILFVSDLWSGLDVSAASKDVLDMSAE